MFKKKMYAFHIAGLLLSWIWIGWNWAEQRAIRKETTIGAEWLQVGDNKNEFVLVGWKEYKGERTAYYLRPADLEQLAEREEKRILWAHWSEYPEDPRPKNVRVVVQ